MLTASNQYTEKVFKHSDENTFNLTLLFYAGWYKQPLSQRAGKTLMAFTLHTKETPLQKPASCVLPRHRGVADRVYVTP